MLMHITRYSNAQHFLRRAEPWLLEREAEHNLLLGIARQLAAGESPFEDPTYLATVDDDGEIFGCAFRTPPRKFGITELPISAVPLLVEDVAQMYPSLPAVLGPEPPALEFGKQWTASVGGSYTVGMRQRIHVLTEVVKPVRPTPGCLRLAIEPDIPLLATWTGDFIREAHLPEENREARTSELVRSRSFYLWDDTEPRTMVAATGPTPNGIRIGYVYTPPAFRGRGYASAAVASLSQRLLDAGRRFCFLYTDLANPTSNAIYQRIGYVPVRDVVDVVFSKQ